MWLGRCEDAASLLDAGALVEVELGGGFGVDRALTPRDIRRAGTPIERGRLIEVELGGVEVELEGELGRCAGGRERRWPGGQAEVALPHATCVARGAPGSRMARTGCGSVRKAMMRSSPPQDGQTSGSTS